MEDVKWGMLSGGGSTREVTHELREVRLSLPSIERVRHLCCLPTVKKERVSDIDVTEEGELLT